MHSEIENLINMALADGEVTEKERGIILRKAEALGEDKDEIEMILDGRLHQLEVSKYKEKEKVGNIKICPSCGSSVKAMQLNCKDCNHEFSSIVEKYSVSQLMEEIQKVNIDNYEDKDNYYKKIASIIKSSLIPNTANDIFEFGIKAVSEIDSQLNHWREDSTAWKHKAEDCIMKLRVIETQDSRYIQLRSELEKSFEAKVNRIKKNDRNDWLMISVIIILIALGFFFYKFLS